MWHSGAVWDLIEQARPSSQGGLRGLLAKLSKPDERKRSSALPESLQAVLEPLSDDEVMGFGRRFTEELIRLNRWELWGAGYTIAGGMSDDGFHYFRSWLIGKGLAAVEQALSDPDGLGPFVDDPEVENELLEYVAVELLEERGVAEDPRDSVEGSADGEPSGKPFDEETVNDSYPKLAAQFAN